MLLTVVLILTFAFVFILLWPLGLCCICFYSYLKTSWPLLHLRNELLPTLALVKSGGSKCSHANKNKNPFALVAAAHLRCGCNLRKSKGTLSFAVVTSGGSKCSHANKNTKTHRQKTISSFEVANLIEIFAPLFVQFSFNILSIFNDAPLLALGFFFKLFFVFFLIPVNLYLVLKHNKEEGNKVNFLQSGPGGKDPKKWIYILAVG